MTLKGLHDVVQAVFGWQDYHLFEFRIGEKLYGIPEPEEDFDRKVMHAKLVKLETLFAKGIDRFDYVYGFGDNWKLEIVIERVGEAEPPRLTVIPLFLAAQATIVYMTTVVI